MANNPITKEDFATFFPPPEFSVEMVDRLWPRVDAEWPCIFGGSPDVPCDRVAILNLMAHLMWLAVQDLAGATEAAEGGDNAGVLGSSARMVQSQSAGSVSMGFAAGFSSGDAEDAWLATSPYGEKYLMLIRKNAPWVDWV
jgi:hypothetical protein